MEIVKLSFVLGAVFVLSPLIVLGNFNQSCKDGLRLSVDANLNIHKGDIISNSIECLTINSQSVYFSNDAFDELPNLKYLDVRVNDISNSDGIFEPGNYTNLVAMKVYNSRRYNSYLYIKGFYPNLEYLDLSNNHITESRILSDDLFPKLKHLNLSNNELSLQNWQILRGLTVFDLSGNSLSSFQWLRQTNLSLLKLDNNELTRIGDTYNGMDLQNLQELTYLSAANNKITYISPYAFTDTVNLQFLDLSGNFLTSLTPTTFSHLENLETLLLDDNKINEMPNISVNITSLSLNCNNITTIDNLFNMPNLRRLSLKRNLITYVNPSMFRNQTLLEELLLNDNQLYYLPAGWYTRSRNLRYLDLSGNNFTTLESIIQSSDMPVTSLFVNRNPLKLLQWTTFQIIPKNMSIYLNIGSEEPTITCKHLNAQYVSQYGPQYGLQHEL